MNTLRRTLCLLFAVLLLAGLLCFAGLTVAAEEATSGEQEYQTADTSALKFCATSLTLNSKISLNFYVRQASNEAFAGHLRVDAVIDGTTVNTVYSTATINGVAYYRFAVTGLTPESIGRTVTAKLYVEGNDTPVNTYSYSILQYLKNKYDPNTTLGQLCLSLAYYGGAFGANVDSFFTEKNVERDANYYTDYSAEVGMTYAVDPTTTGLAGVDAVLKDGVRLRFAVDERVNSATVTYNGKTTAVKEIVTEANGTRGFYVQLPATSLNGQVSVTTYTGTDAQTGIIGSGTYSVGSYVAKLVSSNTDAQTVAKAQALARYMGATTSYSGVGTEDAKLDATTHSVEYIPAPATAAGNAGANYVLRVVDGNMAAAVPVRLSEAATDNDTGTNLYKFKDEAVVGNADEKVDYTQSGIALPKETQVHTVTFHYKNASGGDMTASRSVLHGGYATAPFAPATYTANETVYTFIGWFTAEDGQTQADFSTINADADIYACYTAEEIVTHKVTFIGRGGQVIAVLTVSENGSISAPTAPTLKYMNFEGWTDGANTYTSAQIAELAVTANMTLTAKYDYVTYTVRFVDWMGNEIATRTVRHGSAAVAPDAPAREDWTFAAWDGTFGNVTEDMTVTATYTPNFNPINNQEDLANLKNAADGSFWGLMGDIEVSNWTSIVLPAGVTFTGDGHTISGLTKPLFSTITGENTVKNLTVSGEFTIDKSGAGILAVEVKGNALIANVTTMGSVSGTNAGGLVANVSGDHTTVVTFIDCTNNAAVISTSGRAGGILASISGGKVTSAVNFASCVNNGTVNAKTNAGGILGFAYRCGDINLDNCENHAAINGDSDVGGLLGRSESGTNPCNRLTVTYCTNSGTVTGTAKVGGLIGNQQGANAPVTIENCVNLGNVSGETYVGGVIGYSTSSNNGNTLVSLRGVAVYADVTATTGYAGGLVGRVELQSYATGLQTVLEGCLVSGTVTTPDAAAAVIGGYIKAGRAVTPVQSASASLASCVFDVTIACEGQSASIIGKFEYTTSVYTLTVTGAETCLFTEALASGVTYYDNNGAVTTEGLVTGVPTLEFFNGVEGDDNQKGVVQSINDANTWAASRWVNVDGKLLPRAHAYTYYFYSTEGKLLLIKTVDDTAHVAFPRTGAHEGSAIADRLGYCVTSWTVGDTKYTSANGFKALDTDSDKTVIASDCILIQYQLTFKNGGSTIKNDIYVEYGSTITATQLATVKTPTASGKVFVGWTTGGKLYTNEELLTQVIITEATTFTATLVDEMVVTFQNEDGVEIATCKTPVNGTIVTPDDPVKDGYSFLGWTTDDGATLVSKADIDQLIITESITYKAVFVPLSVTVIFKDGDTVLSKKEVDWGTTLTPPALETPAGMVFVGWLADNDNVTYATEDFEGDDAYVATSSVTFTAVWGEVTTVTFIDEHYTSDVGDHVWATQTIGRGGKATVPATPANYAGMTFVGWSDGTKTYSEAELADLVINQDKTFTAIYTDVTYTVTFKNNDGSLYDEVIVYGENNCVTFPANPVKVTPEGVPSACFEFAGWIWTDENGENQIWKPEMPVSSDMVLVASYNFIGGNDVTGISTLDELTSIEAGKVYVLTADITVDTTWSTSCPSNNVILDGDGHTITFTKQMGAPMFVATTSGNNFAIHNLTIKDAISASKKVILIADFKGSKMTVTNCHILNCTVTNQWGGAFACDVGGTVLFENCTVTGTMNQTGNGNMGGFVGSPLDSVTSDITFRNCKSVVTFNVTKTVNDGVGGIIGTANKKFETKITFEDCISDCTIAIVDSLNTSTTAQKIGGFIGTIYNKSTNSNTAIIITGGQSNCKMGDTTYAVNGSVGERSTVTITDLNQNGTDINPTTEE